MLQQAPHIKNEVIWAPLHLHEGVRMQETEQQAVKEVAATIPTKMLLVAAQNMHKYTQACLEMSGSHSKYFARPI